MGRWSVCAAGGCFDVENLSVPKPLRTGTGAIHQECLMHSRFSAPQAQCVWHFACPVLRDFGALRFSHIAADARRTHRPPAPVRFLGIEGGWVQAGWLCEMTIFLRNAFVIIIKA